MVKVLIADDHPMVREGLEAMLASEGGFEIAGTAVDGEDAAVKAAKFDPDVILSDIRMPRAGGFELLAKLKERGSRAKVVFLAGMPLAEEEARAEREGASAYLPKDIDQDRLSSIIRDVASGALLFAKEEFQAAPSLLTAREMDVLRLAAKGLQRDKIAAELGIGPESVKTHLKGIMGKLDCPTATSAVSRAYSLGILRA